MTPEVTVNLDLVQWCSVSVIPENKPLVQKFYQLIEIKLDFRFTKILVLSPNFQGGAMPVLPFPPADAHGWQAIIPEESRLQNAGFKWCNLK